MDSPFIVWTSLRRSEWAQRSPTSYTVSNNYYPITEFNHCC